MEKSIKTTATDTAVTLDNGYYKIVVTAYPGYLLVEYYTANKKQPAEVRRLFNEDATE